MRSTHSCLFSSLSLLSALAPAPFSRSKENLWIFPIHVSEPNLLFFYIDVVSKPFLFWSTHTICHGKQVINVWSPGWEGLWVDHRENRPFSRDRMKHACQHWKLHSFLYFDSLNPSFSLIIKDSFVNQIHEALLTYPSLHRSSRKCSMDLQ